MDTLANDASNKWQKVMRRVVENGKVKVTLENGEVRRLHRFALVGKKDRIQLQKNSKVVVYAPKVADNTVVVSPVWKMKRTISACGKKLIVVVKEIETAKELAEYESLTQYHYRNNTSASRRAVLIAKVDNRNDNQDLPSVIGFLEITSCFLVSVPRKKILDAPFYDKKRGITWEQWDMETAKEYTNSIARISRCVVYPEIRGIGIAGILAEAAKRFATERWHIGGLRPSFLEITAEMLKYWPFVKKSGFAMVGETEGNGSRLVKSMGYLLQRKQNNRGFPKGGGGILTMQRAHATLLEKTMRDRNWSVEDVIKHITRAPESLSVKDWVALHGIYRRPKPVYMLGLTKDAQKHLMTKLRENVSCNGNIPQPSHNSAFQIQAKDISINTLCQTEKTFEVRRIQEAFNIVSERLETNIVQNVNLTINSGEVVLVAGASGSGKSLLVKALAWHASGQKSKWKLPLGVSSQASVEAPPAKVATITSPQGDKSPITLLKELGVSLKDAMCLLASAGLGEAQLFVRPSKTLSSGQRYRLSIALALAKQPNLLIIDEFCEPLDNYASAAVCRHLRQTIRRDHIAAIVATIGSDRILAELRPDWILRLLPNKLHTLEKLK